MRMGASAILAAGLLLAPLPALAQPANPPLGRHHHQGRDMPQLSPEQSMMMAQSLQQQAQGMDKKQLKMLRRQQMRQIRQMNPDQYHRYVQGLEAQWNALPPDRRQKLEQRLARRQARQAPQPGPAQ